MLVFRNPGLIDMNAARLMGVSVKQPGSFGVFGTGLKLGIATILREGGDITIFRGVDRHVLSLKPQKIKDVSFDVVCIDGKPTGYTTQLGKFWEPWMVLRELGCNAMDENGEFHQVEDVADLSEFGLAGSTTIIVRWDALDNAYKGRDDLFLSLSDASVRVSMVDSIKGWDRVSPYLYYRGIRAFKLEKPTRLTYNVLSEQKLSEDRHLLATWNVDIAIVQALMASKDKEIIKAAICAGDAYHENKLDFDKPTFKPSREFIDAAIEEKEAGNRALNSTVKKLLLRIMRQERSGGGGYGGHYVQHYDAIEAAVECLSRIGIDIDLDKTPIITVPELPEGVTSMVEESRIYLLDSKVDSAEADIDIWNLVQEIGKRWLELNCPWGSSGEAIDLMLPLLMATDDKLRRVRAQYKEDQKLIAKMTTDDAAPLVADDESVPPFDPPYEAPPVGPDLVDDEDDAPLY